MALRGCGVRRAARSARRCAPTARLWRYTRSTRRRTATWAACSRSDAPRTAPRCAPIGIVSRHHPRTPLVPLHPRQVRAYREATRLVPTDRASLLNLGELLQWLGRADAANVTYALAVSRGIWAHPQQRPSHRVPALEARPWWPTDTYSFVSTLLRHYREVRAEGLKLLREAQFDGYKSPALTSGRWD